MPFTSGLETEEGPTSAEVGQRAVLRKRFWETRDKSFSRAHFHSTYTKIIEKISVAPAQGQHAN